METSRSEQDQPAKDKQAAFLSRQASLSNEVVLSIFVWDRQPWQVVELPSMRARATKEQVVTYTFPLARA